MPIASAARAQLHPQEYRVSPSIIGLNFAFIFTIILSCIRSRVGFRFGSRAGYGHNISPNRSPMQEKSSPNALFFQNLRHLINRSGLKDAQFADAIGVHKGSLSRYFGEGRVPKRKVLQEISDFFKVSVKDLLTSDLREAEPIQPTIELNKTQNLNCDSEFEQYVRTKTAELQTYVNQFVADLLEKYNQTKH